MKVTSIINLPIPNETSLEETIKNPFLTKEDIESQKISHDLECLSNDIKFSIPKLITKMEYNKLLNSGRMLNVTDEKLKKHLDETKSFLLHLESFCKSL